MNKTSTRHQATHQPAGQNQSHRNRQPAAEPDMIIIPAHDSLKRERRQPGQERKFEYTAFEELETVPSSLDDELAFQEYADDDPARLRVSSRRQA